LGNLQGALFNGAPFCFELQLLAKSLFRRLKILLIFSIYAPSDTSKKSVISSMPVLGATVAISAIYHWLPYYSKTCDISN
jgi:hypothetical protein